MPKLYLIIPLDELGSGGSGEGPPGIWPTPPGGGGEHPWRPGHRPRPPSWGGGWGGGPRPDHDLPWAPARPGWPGGSPEYPTTGPVPPGGGPPSWGGGWGGGNYPTWGPVRPGGPVDPGYGRPEWSPVDPGWGGGWGGGPRPDHGLPGQPGVWPNPPGGGPPSWGGGWGGGPRPDHDLPGGGGHPWLPGHGGGNYPSGQPVPPTKPPGEWAPPLPSNPIVIPPSVDNSLPIVIPPSEGEISPPIHMPPNPPAGDWVLAWWPGVGWVWVPAPGTAQPKA